MSTGERLYRDDAGAALERAESLETQAAELEYENAELRAEVERLKRLTADAQIEIRTAPMPAVIAAPAQARSGNKVALGVIAFALATMACALAVALATRAVPAPVVSTVPPPPLMPEAPPTAKEPSSTSCDVPYVIGADGHKRYKRHCLGAR